jgi:hypothetical protein
MVGSPVRVSGYRSRGPGVLFQALYDFLRRSGPGMRLLGRERRRWLDNIRMDLAEVGWGHVDWIGLVQDRDRWRAL